MINLTLSVIIIIISSFFAVNGLNGNGLEYIIKGNIITGDIAVRIDALAGWFILIINFTVLTGILYGKKYLEHYKNEKSNILLHRSLISIFHLAMILVCIVQNLIVFLIVWEIMAISSFLLVIFEHKKENTIRAGLNYLIQSHVGVLFLSVAFIWVIVQTGSADFQAISIFSSKMPQPIVVTFFLLLFTGFGFKAGFVPFHTWLPYAHPAAPAHISGIMSGVIIKLGIYGIFRSLILVKSNYLIIGEIILIVSVVSGLYGVMLAIVQHNLKRLLAYHSIENIGIIGIGMGLGVIGLGTGNDSLAILGFSGSFLHVLNHSLFKSLLFYSAGSVYQQTGTLDIEKLGGLIKRMPHTSFMFLIASLAICGLPPFNGFISEFLIYSGLFKGLNSSGFAFSLMLLISILSLVLIGGLALLFFTKAFGVVFLGTERHQYQSEPVEVSTKMLLPQYLITAFILIIGIFPKYFMMIMINPISQFVPSIKTNSYLFYSSQMSIMSNIGITGLIFIGISGTIYLIKYLINTNKVVEYGPTWGCGYTAANPRMQYTASSYVKTYSNIIKPILSIQKHENEISDIFPSHLKYETTFYDKIEYYLIDRNLKMMKLFLHKFDFLQNGRITRYILYGLVFILLIILFSYGNHFKQLILNYLGLFK